MKVLKRFVAVLLVSVICFSAVGCDNKNSVQKNDKGKYKLTILTTLFPYYDFARAIVGNNEEINVKLLISPGQDDHSFEPTPADVIAIDEADIFIYNGGTIENWVDEVLQSLNNQERTALRMMNCLEEQLQVRERSHDEQIFAVEEHNHTHDTVNEQGHGEKDHDEVDEHIWTSPVFAQVLVNDICEKLCESIPEYAGDFRENAENYVNQIKEIDTQFRHIVNCSENKEIIFADKFPLKYFADEYGLKYYAAFDGCSGEMEPSAKTVAFLIDKVKAKDVKGIFYLELSSQAMADVICDDTGVEKYQFHSCHNITGKQFDDGITYVSLMKENVDVLNKALKRK